MKKLLLTALLVSSFSSMATDGALSNDYCTKMVKKTLYSFNKGVESLVKTEDYQAQAKAALSMSINALGMACYVGASEKMSIQEFEQSVVDEVSFEIGSFLN